MSQNQEIIEAKLCAYIDGELDPDGRAEIEKHLEANPQHRRLLESLRATRDLLRGLPREQAPSEIAETLNGQLERSVLLDYTGDSLRPSSWPRVFAAAAIIILTAGLGAAVYFALPKAQKPPELAINRTISSGDGDLPHLPSPEPTPVAPAASTSNPSDSGADRAPEHAAATADKAGPELAMKAGRSLETRKQETAGATVADNEKLPSDKKSIEALDDLAKTVAENPAVFAALPAESNKLSDAVQPMAGNGLVMLVQSEAPAQTERELTDYFASRQIQWRPAQLPPTVGNAVQQQAANSLALNGAPATQFYEVAKNGGLNDPLREKSTNIAQQAEPPPGAVGKGDAMAKRADKDQLAVAQKPGGFDELQRQEQPQAAAKRGAPGDAEQAAPQNEPAQQRQPLSVEANNNSVYSRAAGVYVCQMSRRQAEALSNTISRDGNAVNELKAPEGNAAPGQGSLGAQNVQRRFGAANAAPTDVQNSLNSNYNYRARALLRETTPASAQQYGLKQGIAGNAQTQPALTAQSAGPAAPVPALPRAPSFNLESSQALSRGGAAGSGATTQPTTQPAEAAAQPMAPTTAPADQPVNVVILVEPTSSQLPAGAASQPADAAK